MIQSIVMKLFKFSFFNLFILLSIVVVGVFLYKYFNPPAPQWVTGTVDTGTVSQVISVSGSVDSTLTAELSFPLSGIVESISVTRGQHVTKDTPLITLKHDALKAEYQGANSNLLINRANQSETLSGSRTEERNIAETRVKIAEEDLARITEEQNTRVVNAYRTLLSSDIIAEPQKADLESVSPIISGTYTCGEGFYSLDVFRSGTKSGFSYHLKGIESGTFAAYTENPSPLGNCGLYIKFDDNGRYGNTIWQINIPNTRSANYVSNLNNYKLAKTNQDNAINAAKQNLELAKQNQTLTTADPRTEAVTRDQARVTQAQSDLSRIRSRINDHILTAPFAGVVSDIRPRVGEAIGQEPVLTIISDDFFEVKALIPEIDITKITLGQKAELIFDAKNDTLVTGTVTFISPLARTIAGVSYFEIIITLDEVKDWIRGGLNADIDIIIDSKQSVTRLPRRFLIEENNNYFVLIPDGTNTQTQKKSVMIDFIGNDGYVVISGLNTGDTVIAP